MRKWTRWTDWTNVVLGAYLMLIPLFTGNTASSSTIWVAELLGAAIVLVGLWALAMPESTAPEWTNALLGVLLVAAPFVFGYTDLVGASWNAYIVGVAVVIVALCALPMIRRSTGSPAPLSGSGR
jgi:uncharacterized membrane protein HdeD (DUF308 family)